KRTNRGIAAQKRCALGAIEGKILFKTPGVQANGDVVGQNIRAGKIEVDEARKPVAEEKDIIWEKIGMDHALRQIGRPTLFKEIKISFRLADKTRLYHIGALTRQVPQRAPIGKR